MKILFGIPIEVHSEIAQAEVIALRALGFNIETSNYGNSGYVNGTFKSILLILKNAFYLKKKMHKHKSDIVYLNSSFDEKTIIRDAITTFIIRLFTSNIKIVLKLHGRKENTVLKQEGLIAGLKIYLLKNIDLLLLLSTEERNNFLKIGVRPDKLNITTNSVDKNLYREDTLFRRSLDPNGDSILLLYVGRLIKEKGILDLIDACEILKRKGLKFKLFCVGDGREKIKVIEKLAAYDLAHSVEIVGYIPEAATKAFYANCDILILPSYSEGFPMAVFQAIAAGKPVITSKISGAADHLEEGVNCLWSTIGSPDSIAEEIFKLSQNIELREFMRQNNLLLAENFTKEKLAIQLASVLKALLQSSRVNKKGKIEELKVGEAFDNNCKNRY